MASKKSASMPGNGHDIVVIGTSAGGLEALDEVMAGLPADLPASIFIVRHMAPENTGAALVERLGRHNAFGCKLAEDGMLDDGTAGLIAIEKCGGITLPELRGCPLGNGQFRCAKISLSHGPFLHLPCPAP